jgi:hypothetical protein
MTKHFLAIALALVALPAAALADPNGTTTAPSPLTPAQRQAISSQRRAFFQKEMQMHQQLRSQILDALSPDHRTAVADAIGQMVISASPDPAATAKQIDGLLSSGEQQRIVDLHSSFVSQSQTLMQQMRQQMQSQGAGTHGNWTSPPRSAPPPGANDAGNIVLRVLAQRAPMMGMMPGHGSRWGPGGPQSSGAAPPPDGPPPDAPPGGPPPPP